MEIGAIVADNELFVLPLCSTGHLPPIFESSSPRSSDTSQPKTGMWRRSDGRRVVSLADLSLGKKSCCQKVITIVLFHRLPLGFKFNQVSIGPIPQCIKN